MQVSVIVTIEASSRTVPSLQAFKAVLFALSCQTDQAFEIIVVNLRPTDEVALYLQSLSGQLSVSLRYIGIEGRGLSRSEAKNQAALQSSFEYLIFLESDCIPSHHFVANHKALAECGRMVIGKRVMLSKDFSREVLSNHLPIQSWSLRDWVKAFFLGSSYCLLPLVTWFWKGVRYALPLRWQGAKGYNLGIWKSDLFRINGWEESLNNPNFEDPDLIIRLLRSGVKAKSGCGTIPVFHCWHECPRKIAQSSECPSCQPKGGTVLFSIKGLSHHAELL